MVESEVVQALQRVEQAVAARVSYDTAMAALRECDDMPSSDVAAQAIAEWRVTLALHYERPAQECESALLKLLALELSLVDRASKTLAVCSMYPTLAKRYLLPLIADLEPESQDIVLARILLAARQLRDRQNV